MTVPTSRTQRILNFLNDRGIALKKSNKVQIDIDRGCSMARVKVNGKAVMLGNFWDFHPGCHGFNLPNFASYTELADLFVSALKSNHQAVTLATNGAWTFHE
jgi:hypothetical protein